MTLFRMFQRRGTAAQWQAANTVLAVGEIGFSYDDNVIKVGDGVTAWNSLTSLDGKSAYEIAVAEGFEGTQTAWLESLAGDSDLPAQENNAGKYLSTNGTALSWQTVDLSLKQSIVSGVSDTEIGYLDGVTSSIQTQLNSKASSASPTFTGTIIGAPSEPEVNSNTAKNLGYVGLPQVTLNSGNLTLSKAHAGKHIYITGQSQTVTIPANSAVPFEIGTNIVVINENVTSSIAIATDTLRLAGGSSSGTRSLAAYGIATLIKVTATTWIASGNGLT